MLGEGGICQDIAEAMCDILIKYDIECITVSQSIGEQHVYVIAQTNDGIFDVDISPYTYETGGGYTWKKRKNVKFDSSDIIINKLSSDPEDYNNYIEN
jgi:hypothetical protein